MLKNSNQKKIKLNAKGKHELRLCEAADDACRALHAHMMSLSEGLLWVRYFEWTPTTGLICHSAPCVELLHKTAKNPANRRANKRSRPHKHA